MTSASGASNGSLRSAGPRKTSAGTTASRKKTRFLKYTDLEGWRKDNSHLHKGYHPLTHSWWKAWCSLLGEPHTETVNILTHLFGAAVALSVFLYTYKHLFAPSLFGIHPVPSSSTLGKLEQGARTPVKDLVKLVYPLPHTAPLTNFAAKDRHLGDEITYLDSWAFSSFYLSAFICFACSATFHTSTCHSKEVAEAYNRLDYVGIVFLITGTYYPALFYGFYCEPFFQLTYIIGVTIFGAATAYFVLSPGYATPEYRRVRTFLFIGLGLSGVVPVVQKLATTGYEHANKALGLNWLIIGGGFYIGGALMYAERVPESIWPGRFDIFGSSHQIFHVACLLAALSHYVALCKAFDYRHFAGIAAGADSCGIYNSFLDRWIGGAGTLS